MKFAATQQLLLAPDAAVPQRDVLLDTELMRERLSTELGNRGMPAIDECKVARVKYRFGANIRVLYDLRCGQKTIKVASRTFVAKRLSEIREQSNAANGANSMPDFLDESLLAAFWIFPKDRKISNLNLFFVVPESLAIQGHVWETGRVVAYAPEKCATVECIDDKGQIFAYAKVFAGHAGGSISGTYERLRELNVRLPSVLRYSALDRTLVLEAVKGLRLADLDESPASVYRKLGCSIAELHQVSPPADLPRFNRLETSELKRSLQTIEKARPDVAVQAANLVKKITEYPMSDVPPVCLHGDVHPKNAIWNDGAVTLIDLDQASSGDPAADIGSFLAGLHYKECVGQMTAETRTNSSKSFFAGYEEIRPLPSENSLRRNTAAALFSERALRAITRVRVEGLENMSRILSTSENILRVMDR